MFRIKNNDITFDDSKCQFIKNLDQQVNKAVITLAEALNLAKHELMVRISNGQIYSNRGEKEEEQGYWDLFEQHYYMITRGSYIESALTKIGFKVEENSIQFHAVNPYNHRKLGWVIKAKKLNNSK